MLTEKMVKPFWVETEIKISKIRQLYLFKFTYNLIVYDPKKEVMLKWIIH